MKLNIKNNVNELEKVAAFLEDFAGIHALSNDVLFDINLSVDELVTNAINYGVHKENDDLMELEINQDGNSVIVVLKDAGVPFNPFELPEPDLTLPVEKKSTGGLGIYFVKRKMDEWNYSRENNYNIIRLVKRL